MYGIAGSVPRAVVSVAPSRGRYHKPRSLPPAVLILSAIANRYNDGRSMRQQTIEALQQVLSAQRRLVFLSLIERDDLAFGVDQQSRRIGVNAVTADDLADAVDRGLRPYEVVLFEPGF